MYTVMLVITLLTGEVTKTPQITQKSLDACEAVSQYYRIAANRVIWENAEMSHQVKTVDIVCTKQQNKGEYL